DLRGIVERLPAEAGPLAQPIAAVVVPRHAAGVDFAARRLPDDQHAGGRADLDHRPRTVRQQAGAGPTGPGLGSQSLEGVAAHALPLSRDRGTARETLVRRVVGRQMIAQTS